MKRRYILLSFLCLFAVGILAQPGNDDCTGAIELTNLDDFCDDYTSTAATYDVINGNCVTPPNMPNIWFSFTAQGTEVDMRAKPLTGGAVTISLGEFNGGDCMNGNWNGLACDLGDLSYDGLVEGNVYFIILSFQNINGSDIQFCIDNPQQNAPSNDEACDAISITPDGSCESGTTVDATLDAEGVQCAPETYEQTVWYQTTISNGNNTLTADLNGFTGTASVMIVDFPNDNCNSTTITILAEDCGTAPLEAVATVTEGETYWVFVTTSEADEGTFNVCLTESGPPPGCSENDDCNEADDLGTITTNDPPTCLSGCNIGASPENFANCNMGSEEVVWFKFTTDGIAGLLNVTVTSDDITAPTIAIFDECNGNLIEICVTGNNGEASLLNAGVFTNEDYYIAVGNSFGDGGEFEVCVSTLENNAACNTEHNLVVTNTSLGSPLEGPYQPGETVSFCYTVEEFIVDHSGMGNNCQWIQGIVPIFGDCWDPSTFTMMGEPVDISDPLGNDPQEDSDWNWWGDGEIDYNTTNPTVFQYTENGIIKLCHISEPGCSGQADPLAPGTPLPAGWYVSAVQGGNPDNTYGETEVCGSTGGPYDICFSLTTRPSTGPDGCNNNPDKLNCDLKIFTFADGETGSWQSVVCSSDIPELFSASLNCCEGAILDDKDETICSGEQTTIEITSDQDPDVNYTWEVSAPSSITGAEDGTGKFITQVLINNSSQPQVVTYTVTAINDQGCYSQPHDIPVTVLPELQAEAGQPVEGCAQVDFELGGTPTAEGGTGGPYTYEWNNGADNVANPTVQVNSTTTFIVTVTDDEGCSATDEVTIEVKEAVLTEIGGDSTFCEATGTTLLEVIPVSGATPYTIYQWEGPGGSQFNGQQIAVSDEGTYNVTVTDNNGCTGTNQVNVNVIQSPEIIMSTVPVTDSLCPGQSVEVAATILTDPEENLGYSINWETPAGPVPNQPSVSADQPGTYLVKVVDDFGCMNSDSVTFELADVPEPEIVGDTVICVDGSTVLSLAENYNSYAWSTNENSPTITVNNPGTFAVTVTNTAGCSGEVNVMVEEDATVLSDAGIDKVITCDSTVVHLDGTNSTSDPDFIYNWTTTDGNILSGASTLTAEVDMKGTYTLTITDTINGCVDSDKVVVTDNTTKPMADAGSDKVLDCGVSTITLNGSASQGPNYSYLWKANPGNILSDSTTLSPIVDEAGTYTLIVTDVNNGCTASSQLMVEQSDDLPTVDGGGDRTITCDSSEIRLLGSASGGNNLTYLWTASNGGNIVSGPTTLTPTVDAPGSYELEVVNEDNNCASTATIEVFDNTAAPDITEAKSDTLTCSDPQLTLDASQGTFMGAAAVYNWSTTDGNINGAQNEITIDVDVAGTYTFTVENGITGCTASVDFIVKLSQAYPTAEIVSEDTLTCQRNTITLDATNSSSGSAYSGKWTVENGGSVDGDPTAYSLEVTEPGRYIFTVENTDNGCIEADTMNIYEDKNEPAIEPIDDVTLNCNLTETTITSEATTIGNTTYTWTSTTDNIVGTSDSSAVVVDAAGTLTLTVTDDANACTNTRTVNVTEDTESPIAEAGETQTLTCNQNSVSLNAVGSSEGSEYEYVWTSPDGGNIDSGVNSLTPVVDVAATYVLTVTDTENGCTATDEVVVEIDENLPQIKFESVDSITCDNEIVTIDAGNSSQGQNYTYEWTTTDGVIESEDELIITVSAPGTYTLTIIDEENNCKADANVTVVEDKTTPAINIETPDKFDCQTSSLTIDASGTVTGSEYAYEWTTRNGIILSGATTLMPEIGRAGTYVISVMNTRNGCNNTQTVEVEVDDETPFADAGPDRTLTCVDTIITIDATNSSMGSDFEPQWTTQNGNIRSGETTLEPVIDRAGVYVLTVTNTFNNCVSVDSVSIEVDQDYPIIAMQVSNELNCNFAEATVSATIDNAVTYSVEWYRNGQLLQGLDRDSIAVSQAGTYTIAVENAENSCYNTSEVEVVRDTNIISDVKLSTDNPACFGDNKGCVIIDSIAGGEKPFSLLIDGETRSFSKRICNLGTGIHDFTIRDANGCEVNLQFDITSPDEFHVSLSDGLKVNLGDSISVTFETNIPAEKIDSIIWEAPDYIPCDECDTIQLSPESTRRIQITIIDTNGCIYEDITNLFVKEKTRIYVPNAFSPNGDQQNDVVTVYGGEKVGEILYFEIFDRWGERLFRRENFDPNDESMGWDGRFQSELMNPGVFLYKAKVEMEDGRVIPIEGTITLLN